MAGPCFGRGRPPKVNRILGCPLLANFRCSRRLVEKIGTPKLGSQLKHATPNYPPYVNNRIVSHDVQIVMQIDRWIAVGRYECDDAA